MNPRKSKSGFSVAEGLLPLLDVALLLVGFFLILLMAAASGSDQAPDPNDDTKALSAKLDHLLIVQVKESGTLVLSGGDIESPKSFESLNELKNALQNMKPADGGSSLLLIHYENPWSSKLSKEFDRDLTAAAKEAEFQYARFN